MTALVETRKAEILALAVTLLGAVVMTAPASAQSNCKWYGATALKQQQQNEKLGCNLNGPEWHTDLARHMSWCRRMPPDVWRASSHERDQKLAACAVRK